MRWMRDGGRGLNSPCLGGASTNKVREHKKGSARVTFFPFSAKSKFRPTLSIRHPIFIHPHPPQPPPPPLFNDSRHHQCRTLTIPVILGEAFHALSASWASLITLLHLIAAPGSSSMISAVPLRWELLAVVSGTVSKVPGTLQEYGLIVFIVDFSLTST